MSGTAAVEEAEWSFLTFCRIRPPSLQSINLSGKDHQRNIQYRVSDGDEEDEKKDDKGKNNRNKYCKVVALEIPHGADPGLVHNNPSGFVSFSFNEVFDIDATQEDVFSKIQPMVMDIFQGMNSTVLAYGQTGSGKTYSVCGGNTFSERGLIPRSISFIFEELAARSEENTGDANIRYKVLVSFTEVFGENLYDLLDPQKRHMPLEEWQKIQVLEGEDGLILRNINVFEVANEEEVLNLFFMGTTNRTISSTKMNEASSRSHAIFTMVVETEETVGTRKTFSAGKINLVDLAGSERLYKVNNSRSSIKEGKNINLSLHYLEQVIISLRDSLRTPQPTARQTRRLSSRGSISGNYGVHIPYRNSVLTNILRDSLGGNCKSCFLLTMAAEVESFEESVSTGRFGQRCGEIQVKVHANLEIDVHSQLREARQRVHQLQHKVNHLEEGKLALQHTVQNQRKTIDDMTDVERQLSANEEHECDVLIRNLCETSANQQNNGSDFLEEFKDLPRVSLLRVIEGMRQQMSELSSRQHSSGSVSDGVPANIDESRARAILEHSTSIWSLNNFEEDKHSEESNSVRSDDSNNHSRVTLSSTHRQLSEDTSMERLMDVTSLVTQSKRVRQLLDGVTVITTGAFGKSKTKLLSLSSDLTELIWRDILNNTVKRENVTNYRGFSISDQKSDLGVFVKYEHNNRSKKMEIPRSNLNYEDNRNRVLKWLELLNSLSEAKPS